MQDYLINRTQGFVIVANGVSRNETLSLKERGLILTLLGLPDGWKLSIKGLAATMPDGVDAVQSCLKKIEQKGYLKRTRYNDETTGHFYWTWEIFAEPHLPDDTDNSKEDAGENKSEECSEADKSGGSRKKTAVKQKVRKTQENRESSPYTENPDMVKPSREKPYTENPDMVKPDMENPAQSNTYKLNNNKLNTKNPLPPDRLPKVEKEEEDALFARSVRSEFDKRSTPDAETVRHVLLQEALDDQRSSLSAGEREKLKSLPEEQIGHIFYVYCEKEHKSSINLPEQYIRTVIKGVLNDGYKASAIKERAAPPENEYALFAQKVAERKAATVANSVDGGANERA